MPHSLSLDEQRLLASVAQAQRPVIVVVPTSPQSTTNIDQLLERGLVRELERAAGSITIEITALGLEQIAP